MKGRITLGVVLGAVIVAFLIFGLFIGVFYLITLGRAKAEQPQVMMTILPAPTLTPTMATPTAAPETTLTPAAVDGLAPGMYVQISGTEGDGLRLRIAAGTDKDSRFLGYESEVFQIKDGPIFADGFTWWLLEAPYDPARAGWAAGQYLTLVTAPEQPTATPASSSQGAFP